MSVKSEGVKGQGPYVPEEKNLDPAWVDSLTDKGTRRVYRGQELAYIAMPCGGIGAGQIEICGNGRLGTWRIFNQEVKPNGGFGFTNGARYLNPAPADLPVEQGFAIRVAQADGSAETLRLDDRDFDDIGFIGEYPMAILHYAKKGEALPVSVTGTFFSPFIPLNVRDSANPATVCRFSVSNSSSQPVDVTLAGWLQNACYPQDGERRINQVRREEGVTGVQLGVEWKPVELHPRETIVFDDFERGELGGQWELKGEAFLDNPLDVSASALKGMENLHGNKALSSFNRKRQDPERVKGSAVSKPFTINRKFICFLLGANNRKKAGLNLMVDGRAVRSAVGEEWIYDGKALAPMCWDVGDLEGREAVLEVVDNDDNSFVVVDHIRFVDHLLPIAKPRGNGHQQFGDLCLSVLDGAAEGTAEWTSAEDFLARLGHGRGGAAGAEKRVHAAEEMGGGALASHLKLAPGETKTVAFMVSWYFPNLHNNDTGYPGVVGHIYSNWCQNSFDAALHVARDYERLWRGTQSFHDTYFDTTLPYWLASLITMPLSTLAADNVKIWEDGRLYAYEGISFCHGTCGHVYNFVAAIACLFPELERSVRLMQDFDGHYGFDTETGRVNFRGHHGWDSHAEQAYASDAQSGYVLKAYREYQMSANRGFLDAVWPKVKQIIGYHIYLDGLGAGFKPTGVLTGMQTMWDPMCHGPNPYNETLYLAALRAAEEMARVENEPALADRYHALFENGSRWMDKNMWKGRFYVHLYPKGFHMVGSDTGHLKPKDEKLNIQGFLDAFEKGQNGYVEGGCCDAQQLFGQNWANRLGLGPILSPEHCRKAAESMFKYNWTPDISTVYAHEKPRNRILGAPGEAGLVNGAWPDNPAQDFENRHDKTDLWTGLEFESACDMIDQGLLSEGLTVIRAVYDRYDAAKRNPWNQIEGAESYSRAMHTWNILLTLSGFTCECPAGKIGFAPRITPDNFKGFFSAAEGWGSYQQKMEESKEMKAAVYLKWGRLHIGGVRLAPSFKHGSVMAMVDGNEVPALLAGEQGEAVVSFPSGITMASGQTLEMTIKSSNV